MDEVTDEPRRLSWRDLRAQACEELYDRMGKSQAVAQAEERRIDAAIVALHDEHDITYTDIAAHTGMTVSIVRSRYERAKG